MVEARIQASDSSDRRAEQRQQMILRAAVMDQEGKPFLCLVRNVSPAGLQVKLYSSAVETGPVVIRVADEEPLPGQIVWIRSGNAGIRFDEDTDPATFLRLQQKLSPAKRRVMPRIRATSYAALLVGGRTVQAVLKDVSCMGLRVTTSRSLEAGSPAWIRLPDLPEIRGFVRWTEGSDSGIAFATPIPMDVLSDWIEGRLRVAS